MRSNINGFFPTSLVDVLRFEFLLPGGPLLAARAVQGAPASNLTIGRVLLGLLFFLVGAAVAVVIDVVFAFGFTWVTVTFFGANIESVRTVFPMAAVAFALVFSIGMVAGAFTRSASFGVYIFALRIFALYVAYFTAVVGIFLYDRLVADLAIEFSAMPFLPPFINFGPLNLTDTMFGALFGQLFAIMGARSLGTATKT